MKTKSDLEQLIRIANNRGAAITLEWAYGRPRVTNASQSRDISPRLPKRELALWLDGFLEGMDSEKERLTRENIAARA